VINPQRFKAIWKTPDEISAAVEDIRRKYDILQQHPINILAFAEFDLNFAFRFAPIRRLGQDACLLTDLSGIVFDTDDFKAEQYGNRLRFSVAHELGHFFLHDYIYRQVDFKRIEEWLDFINKIPSEEWAKVEWQADEFAGQLLVPLEKLVKCMEELMIDAEREGYTKLGDDAVWDFLCRGLAPEFGVSQAAIQTRLRRTKLR